MIDALTHADADSAAAELRGQDVARAYNPFHLLVADGRRTRLAIAGEDGLDERELQPGVHVVCNRDEDDPASGKVRWIRERTAALDPTASWPTLFDGLVEVLRSHPHPDRPLENPCVHTPGYGSRFSAIVALGDARRGWWAAEGAPCETKYRNFSRLLDELQLLPSPTPTR